MKSLIKASFIFATILLALPARPCVAEVINRAGQVIDPPRQASTLNGKSNQHYEIVNSINPETQKTQFSMVNIQTRQRTRFPENVTPLIPGCIVYGEQPSDIGLTMVDIDESPDNNAPHKLRRGVFDAKTGRLVKLPDNFEYMSWFSCGRASFSVQVTDSAQQQQRKWGFLDERGEIAVAPIYDESSTFTENLAPVVRNGRWVYIDKTGKTAIPLPTDCRRARPFSDGLAPIVCGRSGIQPSGWRALDNRLGFIDKTGKMVISPRFLGKYDNPGFYHGLAAVVQDDPRHLQGYIDKKGDWVISPQFDYAEPFHDDGTAVVKYGVHKFDKSHWDSSKGRYPEFLAFLAYPGLLDLTRGDIHNTFGNPNSIRTNDEEYVIESGHGGTSSFIVHFENDKVSKYKMNFMPESEWFDSDHPPQVDY